MLYRVHLAMIGFERTTLVVMGIDCIGSPKVQLPYDYDHDIPLKEYNPIIQPTFFLKTRTEKKRLFSY